MEKNLHVAYKSQWDADAHGTANDCGPASIAMILNFFEPSLKVTTDQIFKLSGAGQGLINIGQMQKAISSLGYTSEFKANCSITELKSLIDKNIPVIALVHYGSLNSVQDKNYKSGHFFTVVGYREDGYFVNDPNFQGNFRQDGDHHFYTKAEFEKAWADCSLDKNPVNSLIIISPKTAAAVQTKTYPFTVMTRNVTVVPEKGLNVRSTPTTAEKNITRVLTKDTSIPVEGYVFGEALSGSNIWWKIRDKAEYVWSGFTNFVPSPSTGQVMQQQPAPADPPVPTITPKEAAAENPEQLKLRIEALESELKAAVKNGKELSQVIDDLTKDKGFLEDKLAKYDNQNFETVRDANKILTEKNKELKEQRDNAYIKAFTAWKLFAVPAGLRGVGVLLGILTKRPKKAYVIGWKEGATLHRVDGQKPPVAAQDATSEMLQ